MFSLTRPTAAAIEEQVTAARDLPVDGPGFLTLALGVENRGLPPGFERDRSRSVLGRGQTAFASAKRAFAQWAPFDLGWVRVANPSASIAVEQIVAVEAQSLGLWTLNLSRIVETTDTSERFGFVYSTTAMHVEQGEERFLLGWDTATGDVWYELEAVSRPRAALARLGFPITRGFQHRFARDSHRRMREAVLADKSVS